MFGRFSAAEAAETNTQTKANADKKRFTKEGIMTMSLICWRRLPRMNAVGCLVDSVKCFPVNC